MPTKYKIKFNPELNADIIRLNDLHELKDKTQFDALKAAIMLKYNISKSTVYREMRKKTPGLYKILNYKAPRGDVTDKEIKMVSELLSRKIPITDISAIMESETGDKYSWDRIDKIRQVVDADPERSRRAGNQGASTSLSTCFGAEVKRLCEDALKFNYMAPDSHVEFNCNDKNYSLCFNDVQDIVLICTNAVARANDEFFDYMNYSYQKIWRLFLEKITLISSGSELSTKELIDIKNAFQDFEDKFTKSFCKNFAVILNVALELARTYGAPDVNYSKVFELTQKYSKMFPECKIDECVCWSELKRQRKIEDSKEVR